MAEMTTQDKINLAVSAAYARMREDIERIVQNAIANNNDVILGCLFDIANAQTSTLSTAKDVLKNELKAVKEKHTKKSQA